ncbi:HAMP domain-containing histidine kinase [Candidatus Parcubacteria bacterium]|nr:HAMP domain-containing histidine kinase [Patescibacteria group bacterium]MBU4309823.1 HAMP domain-containing histidine kinase [Patescibacteria group bacterium]MBU4432581.1 HAMP domain-containing histidine kinase [Patescibacteria group bacterium]MBU4578162.1 HAMP domain-containing histidine kinase [Patescibacteria group bacterium]MCG2696699.1 HAMP domain-containing histidine kinase [Candidatus Parcubacteria bacterium]
MFIKKKDVSFFWKMLWLIVTLPVFFLLSTRFNLKNFDLTNCNAMEGEIMINYVYILSAAVVTSILYFSISEYKKSDSLKKGEILYVSIGMGLFLFSFSIATYIASIENLFNGSVDVFKIEQYGYFGMSVFMGFLAYLIVKYKAFNIKLLTAQALVVSIIILIASQFAFIQLPINRILTGITLFAAIVLGWQLIQSVKKEVEQREELEIVNKELDRLDKAKNEFINIASHQLRTPITVIKGVVSMIQQGDMDKLPQETKTKFFDGAMVKCNKLEEIINDILNATSLSNSKFNVMDKQAEDIEVKKFFETMIEGFKVETLGRNIDLSIGSLDETVPIIQGQSRYLEEAFTNLITNAIKYTPSSKATAEIRQTREGDNAKITINSKRDGDNVIFSVKDNGIGIPAEEIPHLFQKFFRAKNATAMYVDGTGLGLFIIKEIAQGHGGDVWAESEIGKGTEFFIKLPIKQIGKVDVKKFIEAQANLKM